MDQVIQLFRASCKKYELNPLFYDKGLFLKISKYVREIHLDKKTSEKLQKSDPDFQTQVYGSDSWKRNFPFLNPDNFLHWTVLIDSVIPNHKKRDMFEIVTMGFRSNLGHIKTIMALIELQKFARKNDWNIFEHFNVDVILGDFLCHGNRGVRKLDKSKDYQTLYSYIRQTINCVATLEKTLEKSQKEKVVKENVYNDDNL